MGTISLITVLLNFRLNNSLLLHYLLTVFLSLHNVFKVNLNKFTGLLLLIY